MAEQSWALGLVRDLNNLSSHIISSDLCVVMEDKYPKAKHHYLVVSKEDISGVENLERSHLCLLSDLYKSALAVIETVKCKVDDFKIGFHAFSQMERLHLHVISKDFNSSGMKKQKHWNIFNTSIFMPYHDVYKDLKEHGKVKTISRGTRIRLENAQLQCNQCAYKPRNFPNLKCHLLLHLKK